MTVIDSSGVVDFLLGTGVAAPIEMMLEREGELAAPDLLVFEVLAVLRREARRGLAADRATAAAGDLGDLPLALFPTLALRGRAWALRHNLTAADAIFVALAEHLDEPLATKDLPLATAVGKHAHAEVIELRSTA
ncbi:MAG: type II toxin-antitoxin system VapC family toxin [Actinomycetota bacterium]|nr:type II toxin-antitoxin system VapC family toxin [Actinomycetota bacterium]